ncbi:MAG: hypothetical protein DLM67_22805 [Candidatus Nephthysia bennettiae]|uniref:DUF6458 family protein n=1 Tax=Candidatus Nephthysia bennettiae TaxID=3127016 RepID=UPI000DB5C12B|nr:MAG: hypothetical protein DLM67_22805 [Candidatus Dormibacteraeota bacterium]
MGLGAGIFLIAVGAILAFAINVDTGGAINLHAVGWILMLVGALGTVLSMVFWSSWGGPTYLRRRRTTYADAPPVTTQDTIDDSRA